jgi:predicted ATPase
MPELARPTEAPQAVFRATSLLLPLTPLVGREREEAAVIHLLARGGVRLLTLTGPAGVGKTRLAMQVAVTLQESYADGAIFVDLAPIQETERVLPVIARTVGVRESAGAPERDALIAALHQREVLLVLDNFEHVLPAALVVLELLQVCPRLKALVTSRAALNVRGEYMLPVPSLEIPDPRHLPALADLERYASVALFIQRARAKQPTFKLTTAEEGRLVAALCRALDGLPLAIELAAAQFRHSSLAELHQRLAGDAPLEVLTGGAQDLPDHQRTMRSAIAWSYGLLTPDGQRVFRTLSVFAGGASVDGLAVVTNLDWQTLLKHLDVLVDQNLVYIARHSASTRYAQLVTLRAYGLERLAQSADELSLAYRCHAQYYANLTEREGPCVGRCEPESMALLGMEYENIRAALDWALEAADNEAIWIGLRLAGAIWFWWEVRGLLVEGLHWLERLVVVAPEPEDDAMCKVLAEVWTGVTALSYHLERFECAYEAGEHALALRRRLGDKEMLASAFNNQGIVAVGTRRYQVAEAYFRESLDLYEELGHPAEECKPLLNLGGLKRVLRRYEEALTLYRQSLKVAERTEEHDQARAILWDFIGDIHILLGEPVKALTALERAEEIFQRLDAGLGVASCAHDRGRARIALGQLEKAADQFARALAMREDLGDGAGAARSRMHLARVRLAQADLSGARSLLAEALRALTPLKRTEALWAVVEGGAALACAEGWLEEAARLYAAAIPQRDAFWDIIDPQEHERRVHDLEIIRAALGEQTYAPVLTAGAANHLDEALYLVRFRLFDGIL